MLDIKPRALQRRFAGETAWSLGEYLKATQLTGVPLIPEPNMLRFRYQDSTGQASFDESAYLTNLETAAEPLFQGKGNVEVSSTDIPMFYLLNCPVTLQAKCMVFLGGKALATEFNSSFLARCERLATHYREVDRREIWGLDPIRTLMHQLEYLKSLRLLNPQQLEKIHQELKSLFDGLETQLLDRDSGLVLRHDDLRVTTTMYRVIPENSTGITYMSYDIPDAFASTDIESNRWFGAHFNRLWERTTPLDSSRPIRNYFTNVKLALDRAMERIKVEQ